MHDAAVGRRELRRGHQLPRASGAPPRTRSPRCAGCSCPAAGWASPCGGTSRPRPGRGRCGRSRWPAAPKVANQAAMVALGRPGCGRGAARPVRASSTSERVEVPFVWEFADPEAYARALASTGPAYEAIQAVGEEAFLARRRGAGPRAGPRGAAAAGRDRRRRLPRPQAAPRADARRPQLPARAGADPRGAADLRRGRRRARLRHERVPAVGAPARPRTTRCSTCWGGPSRAGALTLPAARHPGRGLRVDARRLLLLAGLGGQARRRGRRRAAPPACCAATTPASTPRSGPWPGGRGRSRATRTPRPRPTSRRCATRASTTPRSSRSPLFVALRLAFSTVNDALGAAPDRELTERAPAPVRAAVTFGRPSGP